MVDAACQTDSLGPNLFLNLRAKLANDNPEPPTQGPLAAKTRPAEYRPSIQATSEILAPQRNSVFAKKEGNLRALLERELLLEEMESWGSRSYEDEPARIVAEDSFPMDSERIGSSEHREPNSFTTKFKSKMFFRRVTKEKRFNEEGLNRSEGRLSNDVIDENISPRLIDSDASEDGVGLKATNENGKRRSVNSLLLKSQDIDGSMSNMSEESPGYRARERPKAMQECKPYCNGSVGHSRQ
jgi:hypothetical protein